MPKATASLETQRVELDTLPEGYVVVRSLTYGEYLHRKDLAVKMTMEMRGQSGGRVEVDMVNQAVAAYVLKTCVTDHNLEDENGRKLNLGNPADFNRLDIRIGREIDKIVSDLNDFDEDELFPEAPSNNTGEETTGSGSSVSAATGGGG